MCVFVGLGRRERVGREGGTEVMDCDEAIIRREGVRERKRANSVVRIEKRRHTSLTHDFDDVVGRNDENNVWSSVRLVFSVLTMIGKV